MDRSLRETCFVLLWSYFEDGKEWVVDAENLLIEQEVFPTDLEGLEPPPGGSPLEPWMAEATRRLAALQGEHFDLFALKWLRAVDELFQRSKRQPPHRLEIIGLSGRQFQIHRRISLVASKLTGLNPSTIAIEEQSNALEAYARYHKAVPTATIRKHGIRIESQVNWGGPLLHRRLGERAGAKKGLFKVLIWPLRIRLEYSGLSKIDLLELGQRNQGRVSFVHLSEVDNEESLISDVLDALTAARENEATLLILPELAIPPRTQEILETTLASHGSMGFPILTLLGCCHRKNPDRNRDVNEAVLLGPDGKEVFRHRKLTRYKGNKKIEGEVMGVAEQIETGKILTVLECAFGNLTPLICLDLFGKAELLEISHANLLAVPSLSPKTSAHLAAAKTLMARNRACTFVANHWLEPCGVAGTSFYLTPILPSEKGYTAHWNGEGSPESPYLLFELPAAPPEPATGLDNQAKVK